MKKPTLRDIKDNPPDIDELLDRTLKGDVDAADIIRYLFQLTTHSTAMAKALAPYKASLETMRQTAKNPAFWARLARQEKREALNQTLYDRYLEKRAERSRTSGRLSFSNYADMLIREAGNGQWRSICDAAGHPNQPLWKKRTITRALGTESRSRQGK